jgi:hypothetical protein
MREILNTENLMNANNLREAITERLDSIFQSNLLNALTSKCMTI